jgi:uncharacterized membrane protein
MLLVAGLAFNLAHLDTGGEQIPAAPNSGAPAPNFWGILDPATSQTLVVLVFGGFIVGSIVYVLFHQRGVRVRRVPQPSSWADIIAGLIFVLIFVGLIYVWPRIAQSMASHGTTANATAGASTNTTAIPSVSGIPLGIFLAGALFVSVALVALLLHVGTALRKPVAAGPLRARRLAAAEALGATLSELQFGADVRSAILACYQRFCVLLDRRGVRGQETLTPRELQSFAIARLAVSADSAEALTSLFEEARYSEHPLGDGDRDRAARSLERLRADLEG